jgi:hypothetical protein
MTLSVVVGGERTDYECHEVWWADLGKRQSVGESLSFWTWGLGQWCAPFYRRRDLSRTDLATRVEAPLTVLPDSPARTYWGQAWVRGQLLIAALATIASVATLSLAKTLLRRVFGTLPGPTLIVQYLGDVQTYEERTKPNRSAPSDPGHPPRVPIRRRVVTEMVAMAGRPYGSWHVLAHSLGTVAAYNGLTELGHTLPNYLPEQLWSALPSELKDRSGVRPRPEPELADMMPGRPAWLAPGDVINRRRLFERLASVVTYGSPLDKFATLWPHIIATADDMVDRKGAFPGSCTWLNIAAPHDPVAGVLDSFKPASDRDGNGGRLEAILPRQVNWRTPHGWRLGLAHMEYLNSWDRLFRPKNANMRERLVRWLFALRGAQAPVDEIDPMQRPPMILPYAILLLVFLPGSFALAAWAGLDSVLAAARDRTALRFSWTEFWLAARLAGSVAMCLAVGAGLYRWWREARMDVRATEKDDPALVPFARQLRLSATTLFLVGLVLIPAALWHDIAITLLAWDRGSDYNFAALLIAPVLATIAIATHARANVRGPARPPMADHVSKAKAVSNEVGLKPPR